MNFFCCIIVACSQTSAMSQTQQFLLQQQQQKRNLEKKLELNLLQQQQQQQNFQKSTLNDVSHMNLAATPPLKPRMRAISAGNMFQLDNSNVQNSTHSKFLNSSTSLSTATTTATGSSSLLSLSNSNSNSSSRIYDSFEEKLAITGNIFQKRDDWSIISKLPINKQNSIHIRVNDEG